MPKLKDVLRKGETTRLSIENSALNLFKEQGYHATSMRQIAESTGIALGGIYNHFASKEELFEAIIIDQHPYKKLLPAIQTAEGNTVAEFIRNAMQIILIELGNEPQYVNLMFIEIVEFNGKHGASLIREIAPKILPVFERLVKSRKELRVKNPALLMRSFIGLVLSYYFTERVISESILSKMMPKNSVDAYVDIYLNGILAQKG